jgi:uncharacterized membrane protein YbhN (UPF0104 family)
LHRHASKLAVRLLQWGVVLAILGYLFFDIYRNKSFEQFWNEPKRWDRLAAALGLTFLGVALTIVRWHWLMRALSLPFRLRDAFRLGFLGYLLNFVSFGSVGGDLFKAVFVARELHGHRAEAVATVVVDRLVGLLGVFILASTAIVATGAWAAEPAEGVRMIYRIAFICTAIGSLIAIGMLLLPDATWHAVERRLGRLPRIGPICERLIAAVRRYRSRAWVLGLALAVTIVAQWLFAVSFYLVAAGLLEHPPSLASHMVMVPLAMIAGIVPLPMSGLGAVEGVYEFMYRRIPQAIEGASAILPGKGIGTLVSLAYRIVSLAVAVIGVGYYLASRREVAEVMHEVEVEEEQGHSLLDAVEGPESAA